MFVAIVYTVSPLISFDLPSKHLTTSQCQLACQKNKATEVKAD